MKARLNLQIKLLFSVVMVVSLVSLILLFQAISRERQVFQKGFEEKGMILALALDAGIDSREQLKNTSKLQSDIYKFLWLYPELVQISISIPVLEGDMKTVASNKTEEIGSLAGPENIVSYQEGKLLTRTLILPDDTKVFNVITPIHIGGQRAGTYDIKLSLEAEEKAISSRQKELVATILVSIIALVVILSFFLSRTIVVPITEIKKGLEIIGKGRLSWRITPRSEDEIGDLARGVNEMSEKLEESYQGLEAKIKGRTKELEEARLILEVKVAARTRELKELTEKLENQVKEKTKELQGKVEELERFNRLAVGRELKMIELKKEIKRLKK